MLSLKDRILLAMSRKPQAKQADIARACQISTASVAGWINGSTHSMSAKSARLAAAFFNCRAEWIGEGIGLPGWDEPTPPVLGVVAQEMSLSGFTVVRKPKPIDWEDLMKPMPSTFHLSVRDDALAPELRRGDIVEIDTTIPTPSPGDIILCADAGSFFLRIYTERRPGDWSAGAINPAYEAMHCERDKLRIIGVSVSETRARRRSQS